MPLVADPAYSPVQQVTVTGWTEARMLRAIGLIGVIAGRSIGFGAATWALEDAP